MTEFNKISVVSGAVIFAIALVIFFGIIVIVQSFKKEPIPFYELIPLFTAAVYGCIVFYKKYYPKELKDSKK